MKTVPEDFPEIEDCMSNFDHEIPDGMEERVRTEKGWFGYPAWNFYGRVWFDGKFNCEIKCYCCLIDTITADSLREIMEKASTLYGDK